MRVLSANRSFYDSFKVTPQETIGNLIYDLGNKQWDIPKLRELLETILPQKASFDNYEVEHDFTTIGRRIMLLNARQIQRVSGKERIILLAIEDITERKEIENGLENARKELAVTKISEDAAREYAESIINTVREPLIALDQDLRVVSVSRSFYEFFKVTPEETIGNLIYDLGNRQWDIPKLRTLLEEILPKDNKFDDYEVEHEFSNIGHKIMLLNARRITQKEIGSQLILLAIEDITEKMRLQRELAERTRDAEKAQSEAEAATRAKSDFLSNMSHELRTPLNAIIGFSEILKDGIAGPVADNQKDLLNDIFTSGKHLLSLINDILDLSKVEAGKMELELSEFNLSELIDGSLDMFREKAMKHNIKIAAKVTAGTGNIIADERKIKQVLFNLLGNAFKFRRAVPGGALRPGAADAGVDPDHGPAGGPLRPGPRGHAGWLQPRPAQDRHPPARAWPRWAARCAPITASWRSPRPTAARRRHVPGLPQRGRDREPADGRGHGRGHHHPRERGARARDRRPLQVPHQHGRRHRGRRQLHGHGARRRPRCTRPSTRCSAIASRPAPF